MTEFPHHYKVQASAATEGNVQLEGQNLPTLQSAPPPQFGGPGDQWSPESLLVAAVADCFILSFRSIAHFSKLPWISLTCEVEGILDRVDKITQFTQFNVRVHLVIPAEVQEDNADRLLHKAEKVCLITNSLKAESHLETKIEVGS